MDSLIFTSVRGVGRYGTTTEGEIIYRSSRPLLYLVDYSPPKPKRAPWTLEAHDHYFGKNVNVVEFKPELEDYVEELGEAKILLQRIEQELARYNVTPIAPNLTEEEEFILAEIRKYHMEWVDITKFLPHTIHLKDTWKSLRERDLIEVEDLKVKTKVGPPQLVLLKESLPLPPMNWEMVSNPQKFFGNWNFNKTCITFSLRGKDNLHPDSARLGMFIRGKPRFIWRGKWVDYSMNQLNNEVIFVGNYTYEEAFEMKIQVDLAFVTFPYPASSQVIHHIQKIAKCVKYIRLEDGVRAF